MIHQLSLSNATVVRLIITDQSYFSQNRISTSKLNQFERCKYSGFTFNLENGTCFFFYKKAEICPGLNLPFTYLLYLKENHFLIEGGKILNNK